LTCSVNCFTFSYFQNDSDNCIKPVVPTDLGFNAFLGLSSEDLGFLEFNCV